MYTYICIHTLCTHTYAYIADVHIHVHTYQMYTHARIAPHYTSLREINQGIHGLEVLGLCICVSLTPPSLTLRVSPH